MTAELALALILGFTIKHFIADFPLQAFPYMYKNKGTYGHPGGLLHASIHGVFTIATAVIICIIFGITMSLSTVGLVFLVAFIDTVVHYHIDWAKMNLNKKMGWGPTTHEEFWVLLGADQFLHSVTYIALTYYFIKAVSL